MEKARQQQTVEAARRMVEAEEAAALAKFWQAEPALAKSQQRLALCTALLPSAPSADIRLGVSAASVNIEATITFTG